MYYSRHGTTPIDVLGATAFGELSVLLLQRTAYVAGPFSAPASSPARSTARPSARPPARPLARPLARSPVRPPVRPPVYPLNRLPNPRPIARLSVRPPAHPLAHPPARSLARPPVRPLVRPSAVTDLDYPSRSGCGITTWPGRRMELAVLFKSVSVYGRAPGHH